MIRVKAYPFQFKTVFSLVVLTGEQASTLEELCRLFQECEDASIFYHTFRAFGSHHYMRGHYNDVAQWVNAELGLEALSEKLNNIDVREFNSIRDIGREIIKIIKEHVSRRQDLAVRKASRPFYLSSVVSAVMPIPYLAHDLLEFLDMIKRVSNHSIYYHYIESRLRVGPRNNDFSLWTEQQLGLPDLAAQINTFDISMSTLNDVRSNIVHCIENHIDAMRSRREGKTS
jgi:hypothetical protein